MLKVRLQRVGRKNDPHFRVVVVDSKMGPKTGNVIENVGSYNAKAGELKLNGDRIKYWMSVGAKTSETLHNFLIREKIIEGKKINVLPRKKPTVKRKELKAKK